MAEISKEAKFLLDWMQEKFEEIVKEEPYNRLPDNCKKLHIFGKIEFMTLEPVIFDETNRIFASVYEDKYESVNEGMNVREYHIMTRNVSDWIENKSKALMFSPNLFEEKNGLISYNPYGVVVLKEIIDAACYADSIHSLKLKLPAWEIIMRHELGHIVAHIEMYKHLDPSEFRRINDNIDKIAKNQKKRWDIENDEFDSFHYNMDFSEHIANTLSNVSMTEMVLASRIIGLLPELDVRKYNRKEGSKTRNRENQKDKQNPPKKNKNHHSKFMN